MNQSHSSPQSCRRRCSHGLAALLPVALFAAALGIYHYNPRLYLNYILEKTRREYQVVELITWISALMASLLLGYAAVRLWRRQRKAAPPAGPTGFSPYSLWRDHSGVLVLVVLALASFFFAGEEISWGQTYLGWNTPERLGQHSVETNLHNIKAWWMPSIQGLGSVFIVTMLVLLPLAWRKREKFHLPASLEPAVAEWPVMFSVLFAFAVKEYKNLYRLTHENYESSTFYINFVEQINEHKEMLVAVSLLLYAVFRLGKVRERDGGISSAPPAANAPA